FVGDIGGGLLGRRLGGVQALLQFLGVDRHLLRFAGGRDFVPPAIDAETHHGEDQNGYNKFSTCCHSCRSSVFGVRRRRPEFRTVQPRLQTPGRWTNPCLHFSAIFCRSGSFSDPGAEGVAASLCTMPIFFLYSWNNAAPRALRISCWRAMPEPISFARSSVARIWPSPPAADWRSCCMDCDISPPIMPCNSVIELFIIPARFSSERPMATLALTVSNSRWNL